MEDDSSNKETDRHQRDLLDHAQTTKDDLYLLLSLPTPNNDTSFEPPNASHIRAAWRRTALKHHPDKNRGNEEAATRRYNAASLAHEILRDPVLRAKYDAKITREREARARTEQFDARRRQMKQDLEKREQAGAPTVVNGTKRRANGEEESPEAKKDREARRLAAETQRRRTEKEGAARAKRREEEEASERRRDGEEDTADTAMHNAQADSPELSIGDRTVKVRWATSAPEDEAEMSLSKGEVEKQFERFGKVESVVLLKDTKSRPTTSSSKQNYASEGGSTKRKKKQTMHNALVVFTSIVGAHAAVSDASRLATEGLEWFKELDSVSWVSGKVPDLGFDATEALNATGQGEEETSNGPTSELPTQHRDNAASVPRFDASRRPSTSSTGERKKESAPTFSFKSKTARPPTGNGESKGDPNGAKASPSLYEVTMMRLKEAERRKMEDSLRRLDAEQVS